MRRSLGVAVFAGMVGVTLFGIFLTPVFFSVVQWFGWDAPRGRPAGGPGESDGRVPQPGTRRPSVLGDG